MLELAGLHSVIIVLKLLAIGSAGIWFFIRLLSLRNTYATSAFWKGMRAPLITLIVVSLFAVLSPVRMQPSPISSLVYDRQFEPGNIIDTDKRSTSLYQQQLDSKATWDSNK